MTLTFRLDRADIPPALLKSPAVREQAATGWQTIPSTYDSATKTLSTQVSALPATLVAVDGSQPVNTTLPDPTDPAAAQMEDGTWILVAVNEAGKLIRQRSLSGQPVYWTGATVIQQGGQDLAADCPALVRVSSTLALFYRKLTGTYRQLFVTTSTDYGLSWSSPIQLSNEVVDIHQIQASAYSPGTTYVFWSRQDSSGLLQYRTSTDLSSWAAAASVGQPVGPYTSGALWPDFDVKRLSSGEWGLTWLDYHPDQPGWDAYPGIWFASSADLSSTTWSNKQVLNGWYVERWPEEPSIAQASSGTIDLSFTLYAYPWDKYISRRTSTDGGQTWTAREIYGCPAGGACDGWMSVTAHDSYPAADSTGGVRSFWEMNGLLYFRDIEPALGQVTPIQTPPPAPGVEPAPPDANAIDRALLTGASRDPVVTLSGHFTYSHTDVAISGRGPALAFARSYNSNDTRVTPLGPGWTHSYDVRLRIPGDGSGNLILVGPKGGTDLYTRNPDGSYTTPAGATATLVKNADNSYTVTHKDQTAWSFDGYGRLSRIADRYGNRADLTYDPTSGRLTGVSDPAGRGSLTLTYDQTSGLLTSVTDWASPARSVQYQYDAQGRLWKVIDRESQPTTFGYDGTSQRLATITDANGHVAVTNTYDPTSGKVSTQKDARGLTTGEQTAFSYVTNPDGTKEITVTYPATSYEPAWRPQVIDYYDTQGRLVRKVSKPTSNPAEDVTEERGYDASSNLIWTKDGRGNQTDLCYDVSYTGAAVSGSVGNLTRRIDPAPASGANRPVTLFQYDAKNNVVQALSPRGVGSGTTVTCSTDLTVGLNVNYATDSGYDASGVQLLSTTRHFTDPELGLQTATTRFEYGDSNNPGLVTKIIPPRGNTGPSADYSYATTMAYSSGMLSSTADPLGNVTTYSYDSVGRRMYMIDPNGNVQGGTPSYHRWDYTFDKEDRPLLTKAPAPVGGGAQLVTEYRYDPVGNRTVVIDANGQVTKYAYDERDSLREVHQSPSAWTDPNAVPSPDLVTAYQYDNSGNLSRLTRASGDASNERTTDYAYDGLARVRTETQYPSWPATSPTLVTRYTYDLAGNRQSLVDSLAQTTTFGYDNLNRLTGVTYSDGTTPNVTYGYDPDGNRTGMTDGTGGTSYNYDEAGRLISVTSPGPKTVGYRYDLDGNRTKVIYPDNTAVTYSFDKGSKLSSLADWTNRQVSYAYNPDGSLQQATNFNGTTASYSYDNALRLTQVWNQKGTRDISKHRYTLDTVGNRTQAGLPPVWGWGYNYSGEVGDGTTTDRYSPVPAVSALKGLTSVATGSNFSLALKSDGTVWAWGAGWLLGRGPSQANSSVPLQVTGPNGVGFLTGIIAISAGGNFSLALKSDGTVWAWGNNYYGQLGDGTQTNHYWPVQVSGLTGVGGVAAGGSHSLAVKTDGTVWAWGYGSYGQLGNNSSRDHSTPVQARNFTGAVAVAGGGNHSVARKSDGTVWAWGNNSYGQLGDGTTINRDQPVQVRGPGGVGTLSGVTSATSAGDSTLAAKTDGTAWSWGYNGVGALGDGTTTSRSTPVQVVGPGGSGTTLTDVSVLAGSHALKSDGTVWSWGINSYGQLGIGTHDSNAHPVPVQTIGLSGVGLIAAGYVGQLFAVAPLSEQNHFTTYGYDRLYRLTSASGETNATYGYDPAGNRSTLGSTAYSYDRADRITAAGPTGYTVNSNGNLTARGSDTFGYDQANRLKTASVGGTASLYVYDGDGKRAGKTVGGTQTSFVYDVNASLPVLLDDGTRKYVWGLGLAFAVDASGSPIVYHSDGLGSVRALTDLSGTVVQTYTYDEYGVVLSSSGSITQPFQYTGEQRDAETGLVYLRARMYDPGAGRFLGRDDYPGHLLSPQSLHQYSYVQNRPVTFSDPNGRCGPLCFALIAAGATTEGAAMTETAVAVGATAGFMHYYGDQIRQGVTQAVQAAGDFITQAKKKLNPGTYVGDEPLAPPYDVQKLKTSTGTAWSPPPPQPGYPRGGPDWRARIVSIATILSYIVNSNRNIVGDLVGDSPAPVGPAKPAEAS